MHFLLSETKFKQVELLFLHLQKAADQFRRLIRSPEVMQELDRTSGCKTKGSNQLTWDAVFR